MIFRCWWVSHDSTACFYSFILYPIFAVGSNPVRPFICLPVISRYNRSMFFVLLLIITVLIGTGNSPDQYGWMLLTGLGWFAGFIDCRIFAKSDRDKSRVMPPDANEPSDDQTLFKP